MIEKIIGHMNVTVTIKEAITGQSVTYQDKFPYWHEDEPNNPRWDTLHFIWTDGNYSCACNRKIFFYSHLPEPQELPDDKTPCGPSQAYLVKLVLDDGTVVLDDEAIDE
jgi:hypothetical protein